MSKMRSKLSVSSALWRLTVVQIQMFFREPSAVFWTFGFPILMTVALGIAFRNRPPDPVQAAVEAGPGAEAVRTVLAAAPDVRVSVLDGTEVREALRVGKVAIVVQPGNPRTYTFDPTRPESRLARAVVDDVLQRAEGRRDPIPIAETRITEPGSRYVDFLVPGLIGLNIMSAGMWGIGYGIVEHRQKKLLKRMVATPMKRSEFLLSFVFMRMLFIVPELAVLLTFAHFAFAVPLSGSLALLLAVAVIGDFAFSGLGLLVASRARNTHTVNGLINLVMLPMWLLGGVFFSSAHFPEVIQPAIQALPLTALNNALRAIMNEGAGLATVAPQALILAATAAVSFAAALKIFRWS